MGLEVHNNIDATESVGDSGERMKEAIGQETDRLFKILDGMSTKDMQELVESLASQNPLFHAELDNFQQLNSSRLESMLKATAEKDMLGQCEVDDVLDYFGVGERFSGLEGELESIGLNLSLLLEDYKNILENNLDGLDNVVLEKVKDSIVKRLERLGEIVEELRMEEIEKHGNLDSFGENRWIINEKIGEHLGFVNNELLPSIEAYLKVQNGAEVDERFTRTVVGEVDMSGVNRYSQAKGYGPNLDYIPVSHHLSEVGELLKASVDSEGNFDEGFFSTQQLFDIQNPKHAKFLESIGVSGKEVSLLNEKDIQIEQEAMLYFMAAIGVQIGVETLGGVVGMIAGGGVDVYDAFSSEEELLNMVQGLGLVDQEFRMDKTWVDNVLAGLGLIPGGTQLMKGSKLAKYLDTVDAKVFENAMERVKEKLVGSEKVGETLSGTAYERYPYLA
ncbi:hypothetical protein MK079_04855, partial [Candidatus Gracilibacteria bacterium]|nr:hypothetical protein [Candidatus Gracilibacteria bacterium]